MYWMDRDLYMLQVAVLPSFIVSMTQVFLFKYIFQHHLTRLLYKSVEIFHSQKVQYSDNIEYAN